MNSTAEALHIVGAATVPSDLFGPISDDPAAQRAARRRFHRLSVLIHPDRVDLAHTDRAAVAFTRASDLYRRWQHAATTASAATAIVLDGGRGRYRLGARHARGSIADLHHATDACGREVVVKIPRSPASNALIDSERTALTEIAASAEGGNEWLRAYFPQLIDHLTHADPETGSRRQVTVLDSLTTGFVTLAEVRAAYPDGLDPRDWAWMHRRLLRGLAAAHRAGWVHTAVTADNVLIHPERHGVVLVGWSFATRPGTVPLATITSRREHYPRERLTGSTATTAWDVFMAHRLMLTMLADTAPARLRAFARGCMQPQPSLRPDAVDLLDEFDDLLDTLYGRRRFRPFTLPTTKGQ
jgi:serine/threonine protein kinase